MIGYFADCDMAQYLFPILKQPIGSLTVIEISSEISDSIAHRGYLLMVILICGLSGSWPDFEQLILPNRQIDIAGSRCPNRTKARPR